MNKTVPSIQAQQAEMIRLFAQAEDWLDKYALLLELGRSLAPLDPADRIPDHALSGCQSQVWMKAEMREGKLYFWADSDAQLTKGLLALLVRVLDGQPPEAIATADLNFLEPIGLKSNLSPTRANGLAAMVKHMKRLATQALATS